MWGTGKGVDLGSAGCGAKYWDWSAPSPPVFNVESPTLLFCGFQCGVRAQGYPRGPDPPICSGLYLFCLLQRYRTPPKGQALARCGGSSDGKETTWSFKTPTQVVRIHPGHGAIRGVGRASQTVNRGYL